MTQPILVRWCVTHGFPDHWDDTVQEWEGGCGAGEWDLRGDENVEFDWCYDCKIVDLLAFPANLNWHLDVDDTGAEWRSTRFPYSPDGENAGEYYP